MFYNRRKIKKKILDIPVFHDDQHGTAIITSAALLNAIDIAKKNIKKLKLLLMELVPQPWPVQTCLLN